MLSVTVGRCDRGTLDPYVLHPVVRVHAVHATTGRYIAKVHRKRPVTSRYESSTLLSETAVGISTRQVRTPSACSYVLPQMTAPCKTKSGGPVGGVGLLDSPDTPPKWDDELLFLEDYEQFLKNDVLLLFEMLDYGPNLPVAELAKGKGFYRVAWGFLRLLPDSGVPNANVPGTAPNAVDGDSSVAKTHRLNMYKYQVRVPPSAPCCRATHRCHPYLLASASG